MKERPIIFSGEMVKVILEGRKTQTRRIIKPQPEILMGKDKNGISMYTWKGYVATNTNISEEFAKRCPYGQPEDRLWIKESWRIGAWQEEEGKIAVDYKADGFCRREWLDIKDEELFTRLWKQSTDDAEKVFGRLERYQWKPGKSPCRFRSARFMPRAASRITLEITNIRVERLQEISEPDVEKEGVLPIKPRPSGVSREDFQSLWNSINGKKYPWDSDPWVWIIEFKKIGGER